MPNLTIKDVHSSLPWQKSVGRRKISSINYAVVHHDAGFVNKGYNVLDRYISEAKYHINKGWGHISYHIKIDSQGNIYQTLPFEEIGWHAGNYKVNLNAIGICLDGDFTKQQPTKKQVDALNALMKYLCTERPDMPLLVRKSFFAHKEVRLLPTACPGPQIAQQVTAYRKAA